MKKIKSTGLWAGLIVGVGLWSSCGYYTQKRPQKRYRQVVSEGQTFDAAIVPGYPFDGKAWDRLMKARVLWAYHLYELGIVRNIIFSGGGVHSPYVEARIMGLYALALGIPEAHIFYETQAQHSTENIYYSYKIAQQQGFKTIVLCTDPVQSILLKRFTTRRFETDIVHLPFIADTLKNYEQLNPTIDTGNMRISPFVPLNEKESRWQSIRGTMGGRLDWGGARKLPAL
ncbi:YdcF family protein [Taibaiella sp. KBW10]|uniref:YdcF family protein n=1 Tax=Taibaiella sp. KBW10 TaxID=2153357 RepID=UPI000F5A7D8F|nr:YdcF family protein [Taibaiella sp. KBW10]RQO31703.1 YdcF family protein [Taibaiella sp. KBW10]